MLLSIFPLIVLAVASYRLTRFLVIDTLPQGIRNKLFGFLINKAQKENKVLHAVWEKLYELCSCTWCLGFHISWAILSLYSHAKPWDLGVNGWISAFAIAGVQGFIHSVEPSEE